MAWGDRGHSIVAEIAMRHLTPAAAAQVAAMLGNVSAASIASWADDYKNTPEGKSTKPWHFVDVDYGEAEYSEKDCKNSQCLVSALERLAKSVADKTEAAEDRRRDLMLLIHLVGDSTQPLHCAEKNGDGGGNATLVQMELADPSGAPLPSGPVKLHALWDDYLVGAADWSWGSYADRLDRTIVPNLPQPAIGQGFAVKWINECHTIGKQVYDLTPPLGTDNKIHIGPDYQAAVRETLDKQLATGGARLAALLNTVMAE
ncbi:hypothetical protein CPY51_12585 [Rhizobium tubonense]|uniref:Endonuclease n=2 Tax=Rhizobium tubonense TaxID=484088 RepID=A0A2W4EHU9_9HYPH|nr:hypothetical protein CPY51_12585 [Rhizobium tubonense]